MRTLWTGRFKFRGQTALQAEPFLLQAVMEGGNLLQAKLTKQSGFDELSSSLTSGEYVRGGISQIKA